MNDKAENCLQHLRIAKCYKRIAFANRHTCIYSSVTLPLVDFLYHPDVYLKNKFYISLKQ